MWSRNFGSHKRLLSHLVLQEIVHGSRLGQFVPELLQSLLQLLSRELGRQVLLSDVYHGVPGVLLDSSILRQGRVVWRRLAARAGGR